MRWRKLLAGVALSGLVGCSRAEIPESFPPDAGPDAAPPVRDAGPPPPTVASKVDLLLVVDNTTTVDLAHQLLAQTVPYLVDRLVSPACVDGIGNVVATTPAPTDPCPLGVRDFAPRTDVHIAMISGSLGGHGADVCSPASVAFEPAQDDAAHLLSRVPGGGVVPTYASAGFLAWDPAQRDSPPGDSDLPTFTAKLTDLVSGIGEQGCGYQSQLEAMYRFLVDPEPYLTLTVQAGLAVPSGIDAALLSQRAQFLRPDSAVMILMLTDDDDCSTREGGQFFLAGQQEQGGGAFHLPRARAICATSPDDPCCLSCGQSSPGCPPAASDPSCQLGPNTDDPVNLRCFDQKRRFGLDFLYPVDRYVSALQGLPVTTRDGSVVKNPLFAGGRSPELVTLAAIVGVPWQDLSADAHSLVSGFRPARDVDWATVLGAPGMPPGDPLMIASVAPRQGTSPATGEALAPPTAGYLANGVNGHERAQPGGSDLQYACIYPLPQPVPCAPGAPLCRCNGTLLDDPICQAPDGSYANVDRFRGAMPSIRELTVLRALGEQASVASVCAEVTATPSDSRFAYRPAVDALLRTVRSHLR